MTESTEVLEQPQKRVVITQDENDRTWSVVFVGGVNHRDFRRIQQKLAREFKSSIRKRNLARRQAQRKDPQIVIVTPKKEPDNAG
jgi:hypothetical protein